MYIYNKYSAHCMETLTVWLSSLCWSYRWALCPSETEMLAIFYRARGIVECVCVHMMTGLCDWLLCDCYHSFSVFVIGQVCVCVGWWRS